MKDYLASLVAQADSPLAGRNLTREYLQARILASLQRSGAMMPLAFHGGTALRFLYSHGRFSEDLDFALEGDPKQYDLRAYLQAIRSELTREGYPLELKVNEQKKVQSAFVRLPALLFELGLSSQRNEVLAIKIEVDTNPPRGAGLATTVVRRFVILQLHHYDKSSLLSGKLHSILQRPFTKGRDIYDLLWYLSDPTWPAPNLELLNHALEQSNWQGEPLDAQNWKRIVRQRLESLNWNGIVNDVSPFVEPGFDLKLLRLENFRKLIAASRTDS